VKNLIICTTEKVHVKKKSRILDSVSECYFWFLDYPNRVDYSIMRENQLSNRKSKLQRNMKTAWMLYPCDMKRTVPMSQVKIIYKIQIFICYNSMVDNWYCKQSKGH